MSENKNQDKETMQDQGKEDLVTDQAANKAESEEAPAEGAVGITDNAAQGSDAAREEGLDSQSDEGMGADEGAAEPESAVAAAEVPQSTDTPESSPSPENDASVPPLPAHFEPIPEAKLKRAKRIRRILIAIIILLVLILAGSVAAGFYYYFNYGEPTTTVDHATNEIENNEEVQDRGTTETIAMPNLSQMFGKTPEEVVAVLGEEYTITKTDVNTPSEEATPAEGETAAEGTEGEAVEQPEEGSENNTEAAATVTISYTPKEQTSTVGSSQVQNIYLTLNQTGQTIEVYFVSSMSLLEEYSLSSFAELIASKQTISSALSSAGLTLATDFDYTTPTAEEYTSYVDAEANPLMIKKESTTIAGALASEQAPTSFELTYTYDYGASGVEDTPDKQPSQRMVYIKLS